MVEHGINDVVNPDIVRAQECPGQIMHLIVVIVERNPMYAAYLVFSKGIVVTHAVLICTGQILHHGLETGIFIEQ